MDQVSEKSIEELTLAYRQMLAHTQKLEKELAEYKQKNIELVAENVRLSVAARQKPVEQEQAEQLLYTTLESLNVQVDEKSLNLDKVKDTLQAYLDKREWSETELKTRTKQQAVMAELGQKMLAGTELSVLMETLVVLVGETLEVEYCEIFELLPDDDALLLRVGTGWSSQLLEEAVINATPESQIGYTLFSSEPVLVGDLRTDTRFTGPIILHDHNVIGSLSVIIDGKTWPYGVLGAHTTKERTFTKYDISFLQSVANMLAQAIERSRAEDAVKESEEKYRTLIEQSSEAIFLIYGGRFEVINSRFEELFGVTQEQANAHNFVFTNIIAPKSKGIIKKLAPSGLEEKPRPHYEFTALDKHGHEIEVELTVSYPSFKGGLATQGIIRDITERKRVEEEKKKAYEQIQQYTVELANRIQEEQRQREIATILAEVVASVSLTLSTDELLNHILQKLQQLVPYDSAAIFLKEGPHLIIKAAHGFNVDIINHEFPFVKNTLFQEMQTRKSYILIPDTYQDERYQFWFGAEHVRSWVGAPLLVAQEMIGYLNVDRNVSGTFNTHDADLVQAFAHQVAQAIYNAQLFADLREAQAQLIQQERLAALGQMAATVAHDLRNPLMAIRMGVEYFVLDLPEDDPRQQGAALMQANITRIDRIVDNILYIARAPQPKITEGTLHSLLTAEVDRWRLNLEKSNVVCHTHLVKNLPPLPIDIDQLGRAISNLIGNSLDSMPSGGELHIRLYGENGNQIITIADKGMGISREKQTKIFEPFYTTKLRGTGLGLSIVKQVVDFHNGKIEVWSEEGVGTKFTITLPQTQYRMVEE